MSNTKRTNVPSNEIRELPLEELDTVMGGSAAPMGLGGSIMPNNPLHAQPNSLNTSHATGVGYQDHFGLHLGGHGPAVAGASGAAAGMPGLASAAGVSAAGPTPLGLGGSSGGAIAGHGSAVNATSAFSLLEQAAPQDAAQAQDGQSSDLASSAALPEGLGGDSQ